MTDLPTVTVLIPARNESADIEACLAAIAAQTYPPELIDVVVVDGMSEDDTVERARRALEHCACASWSVTQNATGTTPSNLNTGLALARGSVVCRVDARTRIEPHYVETCVEVLGSRPEVAVVGGAQVAIPPGSSARAVGIARALNNRFSMGGSRYRRSSRSGKADTVYLGAFRTADLRDVGGWDERFTTNQDYDLNRRLATRGIVWFDARLRSKYVPRRTLSALWAQYRRFGSAKVTYWRSAQQRPQPRQGAALLAPFLALVAVSRLPSWRAAAAASALSLVAVDALGTSDDPTAPVAVRFWSATAVGVVTMGWTVGAWSALLGRSS